MNTYLYALANPINYFDLNGAQPCDVNDHFCRANAQGGSGSIVPTFGAPQTFSEPSNIRVGVFGCIGAGASFIEGDSETQMSLGLCLGGGIMLCQPKQQLACDAPVSKKRNCGIYDPNCDNRVQFTPSFTEGGLGVGMAQNRDGSTCILVGSFVSGPISLDQGGLFSE